MKQEPNSRDLGISRLQAGEQVNLCGYPTLKTKQSFRAFSLSNSVPFKACWGEERRTHTQLFAIIWFLWFYDSQPITKETKTWLNKKNRCPFSFGAAS